MILFEAHAYCFYLIIIHLQKEKKGLINHAVMHSLSLSRSLLLFCAFRFSSRCQHLLYEGTEMRGEAGVRHR